MRALFARTARFLTPIIPPARVGDSVIPAASTFGTLWSDSQNVQPRIPVSVKLQITIIVLFLCELKFVFFNEKK